MTGTQVASAYPDLGVREELDLAGQPDVTRLVESMMVWLGGDLDTVTASYDVAWIPPARAVLTPTEPKLAALVGRLELTLSGAPTARGPLYVHQVLIVEPDDDRVEITIGDAVVDPTLPAGAFTLPAE